MRQAAPANDLRSFLLGTLSEEDSEDLEVSILSDDGLHELLLATEEELIDEAIRGTLSREESRNFLAYLRGIPGGRERLDFARSLQAALSRSGATPGTDARVGTLRRWLLTVPTPRIPVWAGAALLLLSAGTVLLWNSRIQEIPSSLESERQAAASRGSGPSPGTTATHVLTAGRLRGPSDMPRIVVPPGTALLELKLDLGVDEFSSYRAVVRDADSRELFAAGQLAALSGRDQILISFRVPTDGLATGDYYVLLEGVSGSGAPEPVARYDFRLVFE